MMHLLFGKQGMKIVCGGTTAAIAAKYLHAPLRTAPIAGDPDAPLRTAPIAGNPDVPLRTAPSAGDLDLPPVGQIDGVDLVTEGMLTVTRALAYLEKALGGGEIAPRRVRPRGRRVALGAGAPRRGHRREFPRRARGQSRQRERGGPQAPAARSMADCLEKMGKRVKISYF